jgi:hypothetical protein
MDGKRVKFDPCFIDYVTSFDMPESLQLGTKSRGC